MKPSHWIGVFMLGVSRQRPWNGDLMRFRICHSLDQFDVGLIAH